jgi:hypothetical protein
VQKTEVGKTRAGIAQTARRKTDCERTDLRCKKNAGSGCRWHGCPLLKITSQNYSLLEVLRGASNLRVILGNYLEAGNLFLSAAAGAFFSKKHTKLSFFI